MLIAISGTPGTGKTAVAKELKKELDANLVSLSTLLRKGRIKSQWDDGRKTKIVNIKELRNAVKKNISNNETNIIDGHLSHFIPADIIVILRCRPDVLIKRMKKKGWTTRKIMENVHVEILDAVTIESLEQHKKNRIIEIDTTKMAPKQAAVMIKKILNNHSLQKKYVPGKIDWSERFAKYLINNF